MKKSKHKLTLVFDNEKSKEAFLSWWLDGGGDGGGNLGWYTELADNDEWVNKQNELRITGEGLPLDENGNPIEETYYE